MKSKKAFTLIELLVVIAIIGVLATISVIALSNARAKSRDAKRTGDAKQIQTALELFFNDNNRYPTAEEFALGSIFSTSTYGTSTYMQIIPSAPTPADGSCDLNQNAVYYQQTENGNSYTLSLCLGNTTGVLTAGPKCLTPAGIIDVDCSFVPFVCGNQLTVAAIAGHTCNTGAPDYDKCTYDTIQIGTQCWTKQNMNIGAMISATGDQSNNTTLEKYCYDDNTANCVTDGGLYQYREAVQYVEVSGTKGICPTGWHIPSHDEYTTLERAICTSGSCATDFPYDNTTEGWTGTNEGNKLKIGGGSGFEAVFAGLHIAGGSFFNRNNAAYFRTSSPHSGPIDAWSRGIYSSFTTIHRGVNDKNNAVSIRCIKD